MTSVQYHPSLNPYWKKRTDRLRIVENFILFYFVIFKLFPFLEIIALESLHRSCKRTCYSVPLFLEKMFFLIKIFSLE